MQISVLFVSCWLCDRVTCCLSSPACFVLFVVCVLVCFSLLMSVCSLLFCFSLVCFFCFDHLPCLFLFVTALSTLLFVILNLFVSLNLFVLLLLPHPPSRLLFLTRFVYLRLFVFLLFPPRPPSYLFFFFISFLVFVSGLYVLYSVSCSLYVRFSFDVCFGGCSDLVSLYT